MMVCNLLLRFCEWCIFKGNCSFMYDILRSLVFACPCNLINSFLVTIISFP